MGASTIKRALHEGATMNAAWVFTSGVDAADILGTLGFDAIMLDREHSMASLETTLAQLRAVQSAGDSAVLVRVRRDAEGEIAPLLDAGVDGLLLPDARTAEQVRAFVAATRYPPHGVRGAHYTVSRAACWGANGAAYREVFPDDLLLIAMIESLEGVSSVPELATVDGLDMVFVGPLDLSASTGAIGDWSDERYRRALRRVEEKAARGKILLGGALAPPGDAAAWVERGHRLVSIGSDITLLRDAATATLLEFPRHDAVAEGARP